jgi:hypothetical protein
VFYTNGSSGAEGIFKISQTNAQLLRRVHFAGRRIIRWWVSPRSRTAPTVRPMLVFLHCRFIRRYSEAWVPSVITAGGREGLILTLTFAAADRALNSPVRRRLVCLRRPPASVCVQRLLRRSSASTVGRPRLSSTRSFHARARRLT